MFSNMGHVMTLANSIIGVGILAMPFCFQKCGIILSILLLVLNYLVTRISCHYLIKSSLYTKRKSFEFLAFHAFGSSGKLMVELCIIGYLIGTCIAYFVVVGDLGPQIVAKIFDLNENDTLRTWVMIIVTILCVIPLGMLKNVDSLSTVCTASIGFYFCLVMKVMAESRAHIIANDWDQHVVYWRPAGILQCLPIFSMACSCQMQLFEVFETVPNQSLEKMNLIVKHATRICTSVYIFVGIFGYIAFCTHTFSGNILINFSPTLASEAIKVGFVLSIAFSFPLVIFPCRASIYSLLYRKGHTDTSGYIPDRRFKTITLSIVLISLTVGLMIPSIELVIGLVGSTMGVAICVMFPASCFLKVFKKNNAENTLAQIVLIGGFCLMILGTYANLSAIDEKRSGSSADENELNPIDIVKEFEKENILIEPKIEIQSKLPPLKNKIIPSLNPVLQEIPVLPNLPVESQMKENVIEVKEEKKLENKKLNEIKLISKSPEIFKSPIAQTNDKKLEIEKEKVLEKIKPINNNNNINNDAIKKDEEVAAEEAKESDKKLQKAEAELIKTKELLEKKVDELKQELVKQNEETQKLVNEKLSDIIEKVEEIKQEVQEDTKSKLEREKVIKKEDVLKQQTNTINNIETQPKLPNEDLNVSLIERLVKKIEEKEKSPNIETNNDETDLKRAENKNINNPNIKLPNEIHSAEKDKVFEPLSYKTGEILNRIQENKVNPEVRGPMPLAVLINSTNIKAQKISEKLTDANEVIKEKSIIPEKPQVKDFKVNEKPKNVESNLKTQPKPKESKESNNIETMRRDILSAKDDDKNLNKIRDKRDLHHFEYNSLNLENKENCLPECFDDQRNVEGLLLPNLSSDIKILSVGRDLKSVKED